MLDLDSVRSSIAEAWLTLPPAAKIFVNALVTGLVLFVVVQAIERRYQATDARYYKSASFLHDIAYWFYYRTRLDQFLYAGALFAFLEASFPSLDLRLGSSLPTGLQAILVLVVGDCAGYWAHRAQHRFKFLWAFHTTHHSQERMSIFTGARFHPIDTLWGMLAVYIPLRILGESPLASQLYAYLIWFVNVLVHSRIPWSYGFLYKIFVSPVFHSYHHSTDAAHHHKNFSSGIFSVWDYWFGTAVKHRGSVPMEFGLPEVRSNSLWSTLVTPFQLLMQFYVPGAGGKKVPRQGAQ